VSIRTILARDFGFLEADVCAIMHVAPMVIDAQVHSAIGVDFAHVSTKRLGHVVREDLLDLEFKGGRTVVNYATDCRE
jgi:hypothetical protein